MTGGDDLTRLEVAVGVVLLAAAAVTGAAVRALDRRERRRVARLEDLVERGPFPRL